MTAPHTSDLDHRIAEALHEVESVEVKAVFDTDDTSTPTRYRAIATKWFTDRGYSYFHGVAATPDAALSAAIDALHADRCGGAR